MDKYCAVKIGQNLIFSDMGAGWCYLRKRWWIFGQHRIYKTNRPILMPLRIATDIERRLQRQDRVARVEVVSLQKETERFRLVKLVG